MGRHHDRGQVFAPFSDSVRVTSRCVVIGGFRSPVVLLCFILDDSIDLLQV